MYMEKQNVNKKEVESFLEVSLQETRKGGFKMLRLVSKNSGTTKQKNDENETIKLKLSELELVYRGEVYRWGQVKENENGRKVRECIIIIQTDSQNNISEETVALLCSSDKRAKAAIDFSFRISYEIMPDYNIQRVKDFAKCDFYVSRLKAVHRGEIGEYLGTLDKDFMNNLQPVIDFFLGLKRTKNVSKTQLKLLSKVDVKELIDISETSSDKESKILRCLVVFGFDLSQNGVQYLSDAIYIAGGLGEYNLNLLSYIIASQNHVKQNEVSRLIIARIKETLELKNAHSIEFIRLIDAIMKNE